MMRIPLIYGMCEKESIMGFCRKTSQYVPLPYATTEFSRPTPNFSISGGALKTGTHRNFRTSFCQNRWGWGCNLNEDQVDFINQQILSFYLNGDSIDTAPLCVKIDVISNRQQAYIGKIKIHELILLPNL